MTLQNPGIITFDAALEQSESSGAAAFVPFPHDLKELYGKGNLVPVKITFDGKESYYGSLAKMGGPHALVLMRKDIRARLGKQAGDTVHVTVELDTRQRKIELAKDETEALQAAGLLDYFKSLAYSHQREYHEWIEEAKKTETRANRIIKMCEMVGTKQKLK